MTIEVDLVHKTIAPMTIKMELIPGGSKPYEKPLSSALSFYGY